MTLPRRLAASLLTVASVAGLLGMAAFGRFTNASDPLTTSVTAPVPASTGP